MKKQNQNFKVLIVLLGIFTISGLIVNSGNLKSSIVSENLSIENYIPHSSYFNNTENPISIDGTATGVGAHNWTWAANQPWCRGIGTKSDPYVIENITINCGGVGTALSIINSNAHVIIQNCSLINSAKSSNNAGVYFSNTHNGTIRNCNTSLNQYGMYITGSTYINIDNNTINNNAIYCLSAIDNTHYFNITNNEIMYSGYTGLYAGEESVISTNFNISGNTISNNNQHGIRLESCHYFDVQNNNITYNDLNLGGDAGIVLQNIKNITIENNNCSYNKEYGILFDEGDSVYLSNNVTVSHNTLNFNLKDGIAFISGKYQDIEILENTIYNNSGAGVYTNGIGTGVNYSTILRNNISFNFVDGITLNDENSEDVIIAENNIFNNTGIGVYVLAPLKNSTISNNSIVYNERTGIFIEEGYNHENLTIMGNNVSYNTENGIFIEQNNYTDIIGNNVSFNQLRGFYLKDTNRNNSIAGNTVNNNTVGIYIHSASTWNNITENYFLGNTLHAQDNGTNNNWNNINTGNYWDNYTGVDVDDDNRGDTPYNVSGSAGAKDYYPIWDDGMDVIQPDVPISIDGDATGVGAHNWTWAESQDWCSGSGTPGNPYVIKDLNIIVPTSGESGILIRDSNAHFVIRNVSVLNVSGFAAGVRLFDTSNGTVEDCNITSRDFTAYSGLYAYAATVPMTNITFANNTVSGSGTGFLIGRQNTDEYCSNVKMVGNKVRNCTLGIYILRGNNWDIYGNTIWNCSNGMRVYGSQCTNTSVYNNTIYNCSSSCITVEASTYGNVFYANNLSASTTGIETSASAHNNSFIGNYLNGLPITDLGGDNRFGMNRNNGFYTPIYIDPVGTTPGSFTWEEVEMYVPWIGSDGSWNDPYIIENLVIDAGDSGSGLLINNSKNFYFIIRNCNITDSGNTNPDGGIVLQNSCNGTLINNNCSYNDYYGIALLSSNNNTISGNSVRNNNFVGIYINGENNTIEGNTIIDSVLHGIQIRGNSSSIHGNTIFRNNGHGIRTDECWYLNITNNNVTFSDGTGIDIGDDFYNGIISYNNISESDSNGIAFDDATHTVDIISNFISNNRECSIRSWDSINLNIRDNQMFEGGINLYGDSIDQMASHTMINNSVNGKPLYYYANTQGLTGVNFTNAGQIIVANCSNSKISDANISRATVGITIAYSSFCNVTNNTLSYNTGDCAAGLILIYTINITIENNNVSYNDKGIMLKESDNYNITMINNTVSYNTQNGIHLGYMNENVNVVIQENRIINNINYGIYSCGELFYVRVVYNNITGNWDEAGILFESGCDFGDIIGNNISNNNEGLVIEDGLNITITNNVINDNDNGNGIEIKDGSYNITITRNTLFNNDNCGIELDECNNGTVTDNTIDGNGFHGLYLWDCESFMISENNLTYGLHHGMYIGSNCRFNEISRNNISYNSAAGIRTSSCETNLIAQNEINRNDDYGIGLSSSDYNTISENNITNNNGDGINLYESNFNTLSGNLIANTERDLSDPQEDGINLWSNSMYNTISNNMIQDNTYEGINIVSGSNYNNIIGNWINDTGMGYEVRTGMWFDSSLFNLITGNIIYNISQSNSGIIIDTNCEFNTITSNIISYCRNGIQISAADNNTISGNTIFNCSRDGIIASFSFNATILNNIIINSDDAGIAIDGGSNHFISGNTIKDSVDNGLLLENNPSECVILGNTLINNTLTINGPNHIFAMNKFDGICTNISIDNTDGPLGTFTWQEVVMYIPWISGSGTAIDPYLMVDITIDAQQQGFGILVNNSIVYFTIQNVTVYNSSAGTAGIILINVQNGLITQCNSSNNLGDGILLIFSNSNVISDNTASLNGGNGVKLQDSDSNRIENNANSFINNTFSGVHLNGSNSNLITGNKIINSTYGIILNNSNTNGVWGNTITSCATPMYISGIGNYFEPPVDPPVTPPGGDLPEDYFTVVFLTILFIAIGIIVGYAVINRVYPEKVESFKKKLKEKTDSLSSKLRPEKGSERYGKFSIGGKELSIKRKKGPVVISDTEKKLVADKPKSIPTPKHESKPKPAVKPKPKPVAKPTPKSAVKTKPKAEPKPKAKPALDEEALQKKYKDTTGKNAIWRGAETKAYKDWKANQ